MIDPKLTNKSGMLLSLRDTDLKVVIGVQQLILFDFDDINQFIDLSADRLRRSSSPDSLMVSKQRISKFNVQLSAFSFPK